MVDVSRISVRGVSKEYPASPSGVQALSGVDLDLLAGTLTVLAGPNGAGKTTLLRILAGLLTPDAGEVTIPLRRRIGYIPQDAALDPEMTGGETLDLLAALYGVPRRGRRETIDRLAVSFGVGDHLRRPVAAWSGGLKRRLHLAAGMIHDPALLLLDEPTAGLDLEGSDFLWAELERRAAAGRTVAVVTHDLAAAQAHADRIAILHQGRIVGRGSPQELLAGHGATDLAQVHRRLTGQDPERRGREAPSPARQRGGGKGRGSS